MRRLAGLCVAAACLVLAGCEQPAKATAGPDVGLTAAEAATLSEQELARKVLGDLGAAQVIHVERPFDRFGPPKATDPLRSLTFYTRPFMWSRMCSVSAITVTFDEPASPGARQRPGGISEASFFKALPGSELATERSDDIEERLKAMDEDARRLKAVEARCLEIKHDSSFFEAANQNVAFDAVTLTRQLAALGARRAGLPASTRCTSFGGPCKDPYAILKALKPERISDIDGSGCGVSPATTKRPSCYRIEYDAMDERGWRVTGLDHIEIGVVWDREGDRLVSVVIGESRAIP